MPDDTLSTFAQSQPDKPAVIDDRPEGTRRPACPTSATRRARAGR